MDVNSPICHQRTLTVYLKVYSLISTSYLFFNYYLLTDHHLLYSLTKTIPITIKNDPDSKLYWLMLNQCWEKKLFLSNHGFTAKKQLDIIYFLRKLWKVWSTTTTHIWTHHHKRPSCYHNMPYWLCNNKKDWAFSSTAVKVLVWHVGHIHNKYCFLHSGLCFVHQGAPAGFSCPKTLTDCNLLFNDENQSCAVLLSLLSP